MTVNTRKRGKNWYVFVTYHGRRIVRSVGPSKQRAEQLRREIEARLVLGGPGIFGFLEPDDKQLQTFDSYSQLWLKQHAEIACKCSTARSYEQLLRVHLTPHFGQKRLAEITREQVKKFVTELSQTREIANELSVLRFSRNTVRLIICVLRGILNAAIEDGLIAANPASRVGKFAKERKPCAPGYCDDAG